MLLYYASYLLRKQITHIEEFHEVKWLLQYVDGGNIIFVVHDKHLDDVDPLFKVFLELRRLNVCEEL